MRILLIDFDGVINTYESGWVSINEIPDFPVYNKKQNMNSIDWLTDLVEFKDEVTKERVFRVCVYSSRSLEEGGIKAMIEWFLKHDMEERILNKIEFPTKKLSAFWTIDDRCTKFDGSFLYPDNVLKLKPWYK